MTRIQTDRAGAAAPKARVWWGPRLADDTFAQSAFIRVNPRDPRDPRLASV
jgi:hypothetical protein